MIQKKYWIEHSAGLTVEAMLLDSNASDLDKEERPEVSKVTSISFFALEFNCVFDAMMLRLRFNVEFIFFDDLIREIRDLVLILFDEC